MQLKRAEVIIDGVKVPMEGRIGKNARLDEYNDTIETVRQRAADFTGLSMAHAEPLQVLNYGIGGHYDNHYDAFDVSTISYKCGSLSILYVCTLEFDSFKDISIFTGSCDLW